MGENKCVFCREEIKFLVRENIVSITIEFDEDGASISKKYWAHKDCLESVWVGDL